MIGSAIRNAGPRMTQGSAPAAGGFRFSGSPILAPPTMPTRGGRSLVPPVGFPLRNSTSPGNVVGRAVIGSAIDSINQSFVRPPAQPLLVPANRPTCPVPSPSNESTIVVGAPSTSAQVLHGPQSTVIVAETPVSAADTVVAGAGTETHSPEQKLLRVIETAKEQFRAKDYSETIKTLELAMELDPENSDILQFRGFAHFANHDYDEAAADVYDALQLGNTWNWKAVHDLYQSKEVYVSHLRTLETVRKAAPNMTHHFLLGYQYLVLEHLARGQKELERALIDQPGEPLVTQLVGVVKEIRAAE